MAKKHQSIIKYARIRSKNVQIIQNICISIKNKEYYKAYSELNELPENVQKNKLKLILEIHLINTDENDKYLIDDIKNQKIFRTLKKKSNFSYKEENELFKKNLDIENQTDYIIKNKENILKKFKKMTQEKKYKILLDLIFLTEEKIYNFLKKSFDKNIFEFFNIYMLKRNQYFYDINLKKFDFFNKKEYFINLSSNDNLIIYDFTKNFDIFLNALSKNPYIPYYNIKLAFQNVKILNNEQKKIVTEFLECRFIKFIYLRFKECQTPLAQKVRFAEKYPEYLFLPHKPMISKKDKNFDKNKI